MRKESGWCPMYKPVKDLPNISAAHLDTPTVDKLMPATVATHPPRMLLLYGSLRERSFSRLLTLEAERLLQNFGAETRVFGPQPSLARRAVAARRQIRAPESANHDVTYLYSLVALSGVVS